jgi:flagellar hook-associated protein 1
MGLSGILDIGKSALYASQAQLNTTSNNIANASTPGYSRQEVVLQLATPVTMGRNQVVGQGVSISGIKRQYDAVLQKQIYQAQQDYGKSTTLSRNMGYIEQVFNEVQDLGLATPVTDFFNAWQEVANNPQGLTERNLLFQKSTALTNSAQSMEQGINSTLTQINTGITESVAQINSLASRIAQLNRQITQIEGGASVGSANELRDQREQALREISNLVEASSWEDSATGSLTVIVGMRNLVSGDSTNTLSAVYRQSREYTLHLDGMDVTSKITKGELGGLLTAGQDILSNLHDLRKLVASITNRVNLQHAQGFDLDGVAGGNFFNPLQLTVTQDSAGATLAASITNNAQLTLDEYSVTFVASAAPSGFDYQITNSTTGTVTSGAYVVAGTTVNLEGIRHIISGAVTAQDSFTVSPLTTAILDFGNALTDPRKVAASGTAAGVPGDNTNALDLSNIVSTKFNELHSGTFSDYYQTLVGQVGSQSKTAADNLTFSNNFLTQLNNQRDSVSGVNMDEEAANLVRFQRAYEAAARLIKTADEIFQTLLNL